MYTVAKAAAICAQLFLQQQATQDRYNRFVYDSHELPMSLVAASPIAMSARRSQVRYEKFCSVR